MQGPKSVWSEKNIHLIFEVSLWLKTLFALFEIAAGFATYFVSQRFLLSVVLWVTQDEFAEDPHDPVANFLLYAVQDLSVSAQTFAAAYFLGHGN